jgi:hypothetical protein
MVEIPDKEYQKLQSRLKELEGLTPRGYYGIKLP